jgi:hypothetical protein
MSIDSSIIKKVVLPNNSEITVNEFLDRAQQLFYRRPWLYYYSGYQWRSEPNVGIVTNIDIIKCRTQHGKTLSDRKQLLCVHWPRIFWDKNSELRTQLLRDLSNKEHSKIWRSIVNDYFEHNGKMPNIATINFNAKTFGLWSNRATVARIYRSVCDIVILNDAVIIGDLWRDFFSVWNNI